MRVIVLCPITCININLLRVDLRRQVGGGLEPLDEPPDHLGHERKVGLPEVLERDEARVAEGPHHLRQAPQVPVWHFGIGLTFLVEKYAIVEFFHRFR